MVHLTIPLPCVEFESICRTREETGRDTISFKTFISCYRTPGPWKGFGRVSEGVSEGVFEGVSEGFQKGFRRGHAVETSIAVEDVVEPRSLHRVLASRLF